MPVGSKSAPTLALIVTVSASLLPRVTLSPAVNVPITLVVCATGSTVNLKAPPLPTEKSPSTVT